MSLLISCYILDTFNKLSSFHISRKTSPLIFSQIFSGWFTCPTANGACQACQNILRPITIYSSLTQVLIVKVKKTFGSSTVGSSNSESFTYYLFKRHPFPSLPPQNRMECSLVL